MELEYVFLIVWGALVIGLGLGYFLAKEKPSGTLQVDRSQPNEPPFLFLELDKPVDFYKKKQIVFRVLNEDLAPRNN